MKLMYRTALASAVFFLQVGPSSADPIADLQPGHWVIASLNTLRDVDPCPLRNCSYSGNEGQRGVLDDWNGGAFATGYGTKGGYVVWGGGHNGYLGNEVYVFDVAERIWKRVTEPVSNPTCNYTEAELQDGSPCAPHTYDYVDYHPGSNSFVKLGSASDHAQGGAGSPRVHLFSFDTLRWRRGARKPGTFMTNTGAASAYDPVRDVFWIVPAYNQPMGKFDPNPNSGQGEWTLYNAYNVSIDVVAAVDPVRDLLVMVDGRGTKTVIAFDLKNANDRITVRTSGDLTAQNTRAAGFEWDPVRNQFVSWIGGTSVYTLTPPPGDWRTGIWQWEQVRAASSNSVSPSTPNQNGTYSRWRYVPSINAYIVVNRVNEPVYMYKLSEGGGADVPVAPVPPENLQVN